jgi:hypothetical protein
MRRLQGHLWLMREVGLRRWWMYVKARRDGVVIDYSRIFTPDELAILGEHATPAPWETE